MEKKRLLSAYNYMHSKVRRDKPKNRSAKCIDTFLQMFKEFYGNSVGESYFYDYLLFQFEYWYNLETKLNYIPVDWVFGKKAIGRWFDRGEKSLFFAYQLASKLGIKKSSAFPNKKGLLRIVDYEENYKKKKFNTHEGFFICLTFTTLFSKESDLCNKCDFMKFCKLELKNKYPVVYLRRGL